MDTQFIEKMKHSLLREKATVENELKHIARPDTHVSEHYKARFPNMTDKIEESAGEVSTYGDNLSLEKNLEETLEKIDRALHRIETGTYGVCESCGKEIDMRRLEASAYATTCVDCAKRAA